MPESARFSLTKPQEPAAVAAQEVIRAWAERPESWPNASGLLSLLEDDERIGFRARWLIWDVLAWMRIDAAFDDSPSYYRYVAEVLADLEVGAAIRAREDRDHEYKSTIDELFRSSAAYRESAAFQDMIAFCSRFRAYAPFNNMLVKVQNPACSFYATRKHWKDEFECDVKEDARPMLILAPMHPVMLVYDLDSVGNPPLPQKIKDFARVGGDWKPEQLERLLENASRWRIRVNFKTLSTTNGGFATADRKNAQFKMRIVVHDGLGPAERFAILCHEMAHILLGHLGSDQDLWWPSRRGLDLKTVEIEAESVAHIVLTRAGLKSASPAYLSSHIVDGQVPPGVSVDLIAKVAGKLEEMSLRLLTAPKVKSDRAKHGSTNPPRTA
jgi:hypothetical protein